MIVSFSEPESMHGLPVYPQHPQLHWDASLCYSVEAPKAITSTETLFVSDCSIPPATPHFEGETSCWRSDEGGNGGDHSHETASYHLVTCASSVFNEDTAWSHGAGTSSEGKEQVFQRPLQKPYIYRNLAEMNPEEALQALKYR